MRRFVHEAISIMGLWNIPFLYLGDLILEPWLAAGFSVDMVLDRYPPFCIMLRVTAPCAVQAHWVGTHVGWLCLLVHGSGRVCLSLVTVSRGCLTRMLEKPAETGVLESQGMLWGHILPYPKDGFVQPKHIRWD